MCRVMTLRSYRWPVSLDTTGSSGTSPLIEQNIVLSRGLWMYCSPSKGWSEGGLSDFFVFVGGGGIY